MLLHHFRERLGRLPKVCRVFAWIIAAALVADIALALCGYNSMSLWVWFRTSSFNRIHRSMSKSQVETLVGRPRKAERNSAYARWYYWSKSASGSKEHHGRHADQDVIVEFGADGRVTRADAPMPEKAKRQTISPGMTEQEVLRLAGKPDLTHETYAERWVYPHWNGTSHKVLFDRNGRVFWTVESYEIPSSPRHSHRGMRAHD